MKQNVGALSAALLLGSLTMPLRAETPAFDRPGIAFSTSTLPVGSFALEQGLPDVVHDRDNGSRSTLYSAGTLLRIGLAEDLEIQLGTALYNHLDADGGHASGHGDSSVALKWALPSGREHFSWAVLGGIGLKTGEDAFTADETSYALGVTASWDFADDRSFALYGNVEHAGSDTTYSFSPSISFDLGDDWSAYLEAGLDHGDGGNDWIAGGGLTWMIAPAVQLDAYADGGLTSRSTDLLAGFGISIFFD